MSYLRVDPVLEAAIRPLSGDEYKRLRDNILRDGRILDPIKVWHAPEGLTIIDGHNRYNVYLAYEDTLPAPRVEVVDLPDVAAVLAWMKEHQRGRRNLTPDQQLIEDLRAGIDPPGSTIRKSQAKYLLENDPYGAELVAQGKKTLAQAFNDYRRTLGPPAPVAPRPARAAKVTTPAREELDAVQEHKLKTQMAAVEAVKKELLKQLSDRDAQIDTLCALRKAPPVAKVFAPPKVDGRQRNGVPVMLCSDWHIEEPVDPAKVNGLNEYNLEIADRCIDRMADAFEWMLRDPRYDCRAGVVWLGGDLYSGYIHEELQEGNALSPVESCLWLQERIERMLRKIAATTNLERIIVPCNDGNHGRLTNKIRVSTRTANSLEWLLYQTLAARMSDDPRFEFQIAEGEWTYVDVFDQALAFTHGDTFRYQGGVGGISIPLRRGINEMRKYRKVSHVSLGHFHQRSDFGDISVNGSMIGVNPYSMHIHASPEPRQQSWFMVDETRGKALSAPIWL